MESINIIVDDHGNTSNRGPDEKDGLVCVPDSWKIRTTGSDHSSLTEENSDSPSHSNIDSVFIPVEAPLVDYSEACDNEASASQKD